MPCRYYGLNTREIKEQIEQGAHLTTPRTCNAFVHAAMKACWRPAFADRSVTEESGPVVAVVVVVGVVTGREHLIVSCLLAIQ